MKSKIHELQPKKSVTMSKKIVFVLFLLANLSVLAQKPCEIDVDVKDSVGTYKATKQYMIFERNFADKATNIFFSLTNTNGILGLEVQELVSSPEFIKANCFDSNSRIFLQLNNGKIMTLFHVGPETCGTLLRNEKNQNVRVISASFVFSKENYEDLKASPVTFMRIKFSGETLDYPLRTGFVSVLDKAMYEPEKYFMNYIKCVDSN